MGCWFLLAHFLGQNSFDHMSELFSSFPIDRSTEVVVHASIFAQNRTKRIGKRRTLRANFSAVLTCVDTSSFVIIRRLKQSSLKQTDFVSLVVKLKQRKSKL